MITELLIIGATTYAYRKRKYNAAHKGEQEIIGKFKAAMIGAGEKTHDENGSTFEIVDIESKSYGYRAKVQIPFGKSYEKLENLLPVIKTNLSSICELSMGELDTYATLKIINNPINDKEFEPINTNDHMIPLGYKLDGSKYSIDLNKDSQILIAGMTGTGKSFLFAAIMTQLIYHHAKDYDIYLFQKMKGEIDIFKDCPAVKFTSDDPDIILIMLQKLAGAIHKKSKMFAEHGVKNITQWNKHYQNRKMKRIIIGVEEISFFMDSESPFFEYFTQIVKAGRSVGMHFIGLTQRTTSANLGGNGELKSQLTVITARQRSKDDSKNAIDIPDAAELGDKEFIASGNEGYVRFKACNIDEDYNILNKYVPEIKVPVKSKGEIKEKPVIKGGWHIPTAEEWKNIKDTIPEVTYIREEKTVPAGLMQAPKRNKKNGVISLSEVRESVNA